jgi:hypothetical protein
MTPDEWQIAQKRLEDWARATFEAAIQRHGFARNTRTGFTPGLLAQLRRTDGTVRWVELDQQVSPPSVDDGSPFVISGGFSLDRPEGDGFYRYVLRVPRSDIAFGAPQSDLGQRVERVAAAVVAAHVEAAIADGPVVRLGPGRPTLMKRP